MTQAAPETTTPTTAPEQTESAALTDEQIVAQVLDPVNAPKYPDAPAEETTEAAPAAAEEPAKEAETALFRKALKMREEGVKAKAEAERLHVEARRARDEVHQLRSQVQEREAKLKAIEKDPWAFFEIMKVDPNDFARRMMDLQDPIRRELETERQKREELEKRLENDRKQRETVEMTQRVERAKSNFVGFVAQQSAEFPDIADEDESEVADVFWQLASEHHANTGEIPTFEQVASYMQRQAEAKRAKREQRRQQRSGGLKTANPGGGESAPQRTAQTGLSANGPGQRAPTTLTNADSSIRTSEPRKLTRDEQDELDRQELRRALRLDADS